VFVATMFTNEVERLITSSGVTTLKNERNAYFMIDGNNKEDMKKTREQIAKILISMK
jgi:hypothetical protein